MANGIHFLDAGIPAGLRIYAIGDVHGRLDLLKQLHDKIAAETKRDQPERRLIIHLGDYVDRGPDSAGVLEFLSRKIDAETDVIALAGNHDHGFLEFMRDGELHSLFPGNGGAATARSYGIEADFISEDGARRTAAALSDVVPDTHISFLRNLPVKAEFGDFLFCHAGVRPNVPLDRQSSWDLVWIRHEFLDWPALFEKVIVHGHTPHGEPEVLPNRVNVDTAAWMSGILTALVIEGKEKRFLTAEG
jgi:serine/threonine protein phosphatase 1